MSLLMMAHLPADDGVVIYPKKKNSSSHHHPSEFFLWQQGRRRGFTPTHRNVFIGDGSNSSNHTHHCCDSTTGSVSPGRRGRRRVIFPTLHCCSISSENNQEEKGREQQQQQQSQPPQEGTTICDKRRQPAGSATTNNNTKESSAAATTTTRTTKKKKPAAVAGLPLLDLSRARFEKKHSPEQPPPPPSRLQQPQQRLPACINYNGSSGYLNSSITNTSLKLMKQGEKPTKDQTRAVAATATIAAVASKGNTAASAGGGGPRNVIVRGGSFHKRFRPIPPRLRDNWPCPEQQRMMAPLSPLTMNRPIRSALRSGRFSCVGEDNVVAAAGATATASKYDPPVCKIASVESDIPSLASSTTTSSGAESSSSSSPPPEEQDDERNGVTEKSSDSTLHLKPIRYPQPLMMRRSDSEPPPPCTPPRNVQFNPRVGVREFERGRKEKTCTWFTPKELMEFKLAALERIWQYNSSTTELIPTGTGRLVRTNKTTPSDPTCINKLLFSHRALRAELEPSPNRPSQQQRKSPILDLKGSEDWRSLNSKPAMVGERKREFLYMAAAKAEIRSILIVDPHDICADLFARGLHKIFPNTRTTTARTSQEAKKLVENNMDNRGFDVVLIEERLMLFHRQQEETDAASGSILLKSLVEKDGPSSSGGGTRRLYIGVSSHPQEDGAKLRASGADMIWSKPPPPLDEKLRDNVLKKLLLKRGKTTVANALFD